MPISKRIRPSEADLLRPKNGTDRYCHHHLLLLLLLLLLSLLSVAVTIIIVAVLVLQHTAETLRRPLPPCRSQAVRDQRTPERILLRPQLLELHHHQLPCTLVDSSSLSSLPIFSITPSPHSLPHLSITPSPFLPLTLPLTLPLMCPSHLFQALTMSSLQVSATARTTSPVRTRRGVGCPAHGTRRRTVP